MQQWMMKELIEQQIGCLAQVIFYFGQIFIT
jgi:hypothetical protein